MSTENDITQELFETIEGYLQGTLSDAKKIEFEGSLHNDPKLQQKVDDIKTLLSGIETAAFKEKMNDFHDTLGAQNTLVSETPEKSNRGKRYLIAGIAASAAILAMLYFGSPNNNSTEALFNRNFQPDPGLPTTMGATNDFSFYDAMVDYKKGDFASAITKWEALPEGTKGDTLTYFLGVAQLAHESEAQAIDYLKGLSQKPDNPFGTETYYYLGMAYLKQGDVENAKKALSSSGTTQALKVLAELNE
ncbi:MAG: hypothetical protein Aureis2KO_04610 [Aureisphaera sp.]